MRSLLLFVTLFISFNGYSYIPTLSNSKISPLFNYLDSCVWDLMDRGEYEAAESDALKLLDYSRHVNNNYILAGAYNTFGTVLSYNGKYPDALENLFKALQLFEKEQDLLKIANVYSNIGSVYYGQEKYDDALGMFEKADKLLVKLGHLPGISANSNNLGLVYADKHDHRKAIEYYKRSFELDSLEGNLEGMALSYLNFGRSYFEMKEFELARRNFDKGLALSLKISDTYTISKLLLHSARIDIRDKNYHAAEAKIHQAAAITEDTDNLTEKRDVYLSLHELDSSRNDIRSAYHAFRNFISYRDKVSNEENDQRSAEAKIQYAYDKKQAAFKAEQEKKDAIQKQEQQKQALIRNSLGAGVLMLFAFAIVVLRSYRNKQRAHAEISRQNEEISLQKELVEEKNREILDSINYAKRLQSAILPPDTHIRSVLPGTFIFYRPKDIVAGDFYFLERIGNKLFIAVADCTGHGVPGALVSVICSTALSRAVKEFRLTDPGLILDKVTDLVLETFERSESVVSDGMDISLLVIDQDPSAIRASFAGANNGVFIKKGTGTEVIEVKGDKQPVGRFERRTKFTTVDLDISKGDKVYLYSDGFADQFGGTKGKKFKYAQLKALLVESSELTANDQLKKIENAFDKWKGDFEQTDDVTLMGIPL